MKIIAVAPLCGKDIENSINKGQRIVIFLFGIVIIQILHLERLVLTVLIHSWSLWIFQGDQSRSIRSYENLFLFHFFLYFIISACEARYNLLQKEGILFSI